MAAPSVEIINPDLSTHGDGKWDGGVLGNDGCIYAIPCNASRVLRIDPAAPGGAAVELIGPDLSTIGPDLSTHGYGKWNGGVLGNDGCIYAIPRNASHVLRIDPAAPGGAAVELIGPNLSTHRDFKWAGGVLGNDGCIYAIPDDASRVLRIDPAAPGGAAVEPIGPDLSTHGYGKWNGGLLGNDGCIYAIPRNASRVLRIDPAAAPGGAAVELIGPDLITHGDCKWAGGALGNDGCIYAIPRNASRVLRIDPAAPVRPSRTFSERLRHLDLWESLKALLPSLSGEAGRRLHLVGAEHVPLDVRDLHEAAAGDNLKALLRHILSSDHLSPSSVRAITPAGRTPLHTASAAGAVNAVRILVQVRSTSPPCMLMRPLIAC